MLVIHKPIKCVKGASKVTPRVKALATEPNDLSLKFETHMVKESIPSNLPSIRHMCM